MTIAIPSFSGFLGGVSTLRVNLVSWWTMNETSGTRYDSHGSSDLSDNNTVGYATGKQGNAADFELSNSEYLSRNLGASELAFSTGMTWAYWVKHESVGTTLSQRHVSIRDTTSPQYTEVRISWESTTDRWNFVVVDASTKAFREVNWTSAYPSTGTWYFICAWFDGSDNKMYLSINNATPVSATVTNGMYDGSSGSTRRIEIGKLVGFAGNYMDGLIDEMGVWSRALTSDERTWLYNSGSGRTYTDL